MKKIIIISAVLLSLLAGSALLPLASAQSQSSNQNQYANDFERLKTESFGKTQPITYAVIFVTSKNQCDDSDYQRLKFYQVLADEYLSLYQIQHNQEGGLCVSTNNFKQSFTSLSSSTLPIVIMDKTAGTQLLTKKGYLGLYYFPDVSGKQSILVCACDNDVESLNGAWVLSHELSHFSLNYYGAPQTIADWVHQVQTLVNNCESVQHQKFCSTYSTYVASPSGNEIPVMEIYGQGSASNIPSNIQGSEATVFPETLPALQSKAPTAQTPEFGSVSVLVFTLAIMSIIVIYFRRNSISKI